VSSGDLAAAQLILVGGGVRETLFALPLVRALPGAIVFAPPIGLSTLAGLDASNRAFGLGDGVPAWVIAWRRLRREPTAVAILPPPVRLGRALLAYLQGIPRRIQVKGQYDWCATEQVEVPAGTHPVEATRRLVMALGSGSSQQTETAPAIYPSNAARSRADERLAAAGRAPSRHFLVLIPGGGNWQRARRGPLWPAERFAIVANQVAGGPVLLVRGTGDSAVVRETAASIRFPSLILDVRELTPPELAAVMERSRGVIGHDGDALHVAAASRTNVLGLLSATDIGPYGPRNGGLRHQDLPNLPARAVVQAAEHYLLVSNHV